ncbi:radical SAM protein [Acetobacter sp. LMG 32666]|uniref:radical SAM protein n=1 Tax=Acetobacter sp. LMG 32666 TaxID=2959295 RepID=UPI0030C89AF3
MTEPGVDAAIFPMAVTKRLYYDYPKEGYDVMQRDALGADQAIRNCMTVRTSQKSHQTNSWKLRYGPAGLHVFNRTSGLNVLIDEVRIPASLHSRAPRQVSMALTNRCDLACAHCYAPKSRDQLRFDLVTQWLAELDSHGALGVGFGGGEPTLYPEFERLCHYVARETQLSVSFTTHGHHIDGALAESLCGSVNFVRVSMDGVGTTYESIRRRSFPALLTCLKHIRCISDFGVNVVINERTLFDLDEVAIIAADAGASELLVLPQVPVRGVPVISPDILHGLRLWVESYRGPLKLCINEVSADGFPICNPLAEERGLLAYAHIDAKGVLKPSSYAEAGVRLGEGGLLQAMDQLANDIGGNDT